MRFKKPSETLTLTFIRWVIRRSQRNLQRLVRLLVDVLSQLFYPAWCRNNEMALVSALVTSIPSGTSKSLFLSQFNEFLTLNF